MTQIYETITAATSFEAQQIAKSKYGDNIDIVKEERVKDKALLGFVSKELVRLTIVRRSDGISTKFPTPSYSMQSSDIIGSRSCDKSKTPPSACVTPPITVPKNLASSLYRKTQQLDRDVDGIRSIQEGNSEPHSQKNLNDDFAQNASKLLSSLQGIKEGRNKEKDVANEIKINSLTTKKFNELHNEIDRLLEVITNITQNSNDFLFGKNNLPQGLLDLKQQLQEIEMPQEVIDLIFRDLRLNCTEETLNKPYETKKALNELIKKQISISSKFELKKTSKPQVIILMGPTGVGKTTTLVKLAAKFCLDPDKPIKASIINIDFYKLGAKEQLQKYAGIFGIPLEDVTSIASLDYLLEKHKSDDLIIVDTAGRSQYAYEDIKELKSYIDRIPNATKYLTLSSTSKYSDLKEIADSFGQVGFDHLILTKTDETKTMGPAIGMLLKSKKSLAYITHGQQVPDDYRVASFDFFEEKMFRPNSYGYKKIK